MPQQNAANQSLLGKHTPYCHTYDPGLLFPIPRQEKRTELGISSDSLPFSGQDVWTAYEVSWLNAKGKPLVAWAEFIFSAYSPNLIESKSFKLYLNSFNGTRFESVQAVIDSWQRDLSAASGAPVEVRLHDLSEDQQLVGSMPGECLDGLDIEISHYQVLPSLLQVKSSTEVAACWHSHLLKSNCLVTGQPDWGSVLIRYEGPEIDPEGLLRYIISFREHNEFHEQCVERIFCDIMAQCAPTKLTVYARYLRRGGLDINPYRSNFEKTFNLSRLIRQ
ncbi:NADPH-dependent 7-cyano-7-deazaguanine reductase QueF [Hydrogenovibrio sp. SC-1]|uniref:NADPH-dependent 7-cyano-7-deazaguanine reductase QueF n=1 Tax=Hydrogenovibrio sp. SC-1 TaxID=2065820 RepID=UPI000C795E2E|nr:NADPH-dependent 7-cyano-7-deazaguanine reductase QueF [Hydrogenovibrio sp. SC-1]PLA74722.1 NADPH-dependent 7-cyano-7-deazaguanine reductase QueF [Hydrogenovibrio sp. SC-1]